MNEYIINFFKRNPEAKTAHLVLDQVFAKREQADRYRKLTGAKMVTTVQRSEYDKWLSEQEKNNSKPEETK